MFSFKCKSHSLLCRMAICIAMVALPCCLLTSAQGQTIEKPQFVDLSEHLDIYVSVIDPTMVKDVFGKRVAQQFVAIQVTISNKNSNYQFLIHDVSLDLRDVFGRAYARNIIENDLRECRDQCAQDIKECELENIQRGVKEPCVCDFECSSKKFELSSLELSLIRGVAERGQGEDTRNKVLRFFRAFGTIAAGLIGVASFGPGYAKSVAVFNGPVINAYSELYPDYTINQMNRLSDSAYKANTLVPKPQSKVIVAFIPQAIFLSKRQRKLFWQDPTQLYPQYSRQGAVSIDPNAAANEAPFVDWRRTVARVDGSLITEIKNLAPSVTGVQIDDDEARKFHDLKPVVKGYVLGRFLEGTKIDLVSPPPGVTIELNGTPEEDRINFTIKSDEPIPSGTNLNIRVFNSQGTQTFIKSVAFNTPGPTLDDPDPQEGDRGTESLSVTLKGKNFIEGITEVQPPTGKGVRLVDQTFVSDEEITITLKIDAVADEFVKLRVMNGDVSSNTVKFKTKAP